MNEAFQVTLTVEMPDTIIRSNGGNAEGNKITFDIADITEAKELSAESESVNTGLAVGIIIWAAVIIIVIACVVKSKRR